MVSISVFVCFGSKLLLSAVLSFAASPGGRAIYTLSASFSRRVIIHRRMHEGQDVPLDQKCS